MAKYFLKMKRILQTSPCLLLLIFATNNCCEVVSWKQNQVALVLICFELICVFVFIMFWRLFLVKCTFLFCSDLASLMFNIILTIYFSLLKMQSLSLTNHILLKLFFAIFDKFTICLLLKLNNQNIGKHLTHNGCKFTFLSNNVKGLPNSLKRIKISEYLRNNLALMDFCFSKKPIHAQLMQRNGQMN